MNGLPAWFHHGHIALGLGIFLPVTTLIAAGDRDTKVREDKTQVESAGHWIYNDLDRALQEGRQTGKPLLVTLRCIS